MHENTIRSILFQFLPDLWLNLSIDSESRICDSNSIAGFCHKSENTLYILLLIHLFSCFNLFSTRTNGTRKQMMSAIKSGHVAYSRFARMAELEEEKHEVEKLKKKISVDRSGGGL